MIYDPFESKDKIPVDETAEIIFVLDTQFISEDKKLFSKVKQGILKALRDIPVEYKYNFIALGNDIAEMWEESQYATEVNNGYWLNLYFNMFNRITSNLQTNI